jgi:hypothetical protein
MGDWAVMAKYCWLYLHSIKKRTSIHLECLDNYNTITENIISRRKGEGLIAHTGCAHAN